MQTSRALSRLAIHLLIGFTALFPTACATRSARIETVEAIPPMQMLEPCDRPRIDRLDTNGDLARLASELAYSLDVCAAKIEALRTYFDITSDNP